MSYRLEGTERKFVNYVGYGSLAPAVAGVLLDRALPTLRVYVPKYELRILPIDYMTEQERFIMEGMSRYVAVYNPKAKQDLAAWVFQNLSPEDIKLLKEFDISYRPAYWTKTVQYMRKGRLDTGLMVVRRRSRFNGFSVPPSDYTPYRPFSPNPSEGRKIAQDAARAIRNATLRG